MSPKRIPRTKKTFFVGNVNDALLRFFCAVGKRSDCANFDKTKTHFQKRLGTFASRVVTCINVLCSKIGGSQQNVRVVYYPQLNRSDWAMEAPPRSSSKRDRRCAYLKAVCPNVPNVTSWRTVHIGYDVLIRRLDATYIHR